MESSKIKCILEDLGYKLKDKGLYWQCAALYRDGDNETALQIYKDSGAWKDYVKDTPFMPFKQLLILTLNTNDPKELSKYLNKDDITFLSERSSSLNEKIEMDEVYPESYLSKLLPHYKFYNDRGIEDRILKRLRGGLATKGKMYQRFVFPVYNEHGQIHGFSGRDMSSKDNRPKWKHIGKKKNWIYPAHVPVPLDKKTVDFAEYNSIIIVESIGDCLSLMQNGFKNVAVSFGLDISSKLCCWMIELGFKKVYISFNNDNADPENNRGLQAAIKNYLKLLNYFDKDMLRICLPNKNDFGDMSTEDFIKWKSKYGKIEKMDQSKLVVDHARALYKRNQISKNLMKNIKLLDEQA
jgi:DNA primase